MLKSQRELGVPAVGSEELTEKTASGIKPEQGAALVAWLASDRARNANGRTFMVSRQEIGLYCEPESVRIVFHPRGRTFEALDDPADEAFLTGTPQNCVRRPMTDTIPE